MGIPRRKHGVTIHNEKACDGYTLIVPYTSKDVWLIDMRGNYVHRWVMPTSARNHAVFLPNGHLLYAIRAPLPPESDMSVPRHWGTGGGIIEVDWEDNSVWKYVDKLQNHTFYRMKNGNTIFPRFEAVPDEIAVRVKGGLPGTEDRGMMWTDGLHEVTPDGKVVWKWAAFDHLNPDIHTLCPLSLRGEWTHMNSCEGLPDGNILTSCRNIDLIFIIDKVTGKIKWEWGRGEISHQHAPTLLDNGNILVFDNGAHRQDGSLISYSRAVEVNPVTNKIEWEYKANPPQDFYSALISNCQRLPNGNTLICEGLKGRVFEVTMDREIVWQYISPFYAPDPYKPPWGCTNALFRAYRYMPDYLGLEGKTLDSSKLSWVNRVYGPEALAS